MNYVTKCSRKGLIMALRASGELGSPGQLKDPAAACPAGEFHSPGLKLILGGKSQGVAC
jgi:hypothetical protein